MQMRGGRVAIVADSHTHASLNLEDSITNGNGGGGVIDDGTAVSENIAAPTEALIHDRGVTWTQVGMPAAATDRPNSARSRQSLSFDANLDTRGCRFN